MDQLRLVHWYDHRERSHPQSNQFLQAQKLRSKKHTGIHETPAMKRPIMMYLYLRASLQTTPQAEDHPASQDDRSTTVHSPVGLGNLGG